jgi:NAD(P)-dependent dehydrogenase (short-subunit alcohol dehydrogenase family)
VTVADINETAGKEMVTALSSAASQFIKCDVRSWDDQVSVFEAAVNNSPSNSCDIVIANAGIVGADDLYELEGEMFSYIYLLYPIWISKTNNQ